MKKLIDALKVIQDECNKYAESDDGCADCPMGNDEGDCLANYSVPCEWTIDDRTRKVRVLK